MDPSVMSEPARLDADDLLAHAGWVRALAARLARDQAEADDVSQDALAAALANPPRADRPVRPWLGRVLGNALRARRRGERRRAAHELGASHERPRSGADGAELLEVLEEQRRLTGLVAELPEPYRSAILARYFRGESAARIARRTGANAATVRTHLARGRELLRARFEASLPRRGRGDALRALVVAAGGGRGLPLPLATAAAAATGVLAVNTTTKLLLAGAACAALIGVLVSVDAIQLRPERPTSEPVAARPDAALRDPGAPAASEGKPLAASAGAGERLPSPAAGAAPVDSAPPASPVAPPPAVVVARVVDGDGAPLAGAVLAFAGPPEAASSPSGADGRVELELPRGAHLHFGDQLVTNTYRATAPGRALAFFRATAAPEERTDLGEIELAPGGAVSGVVIDALGAPVPNAEVVVADGRSSGAAADALAGPALGLGRPTARSSAGGAFRVDAAPTGPARVWARVGQGAWGVSDVASVPAGGEVPGVRVELPATGDDAWIRGRVLDPAGAPVANAIVAYTESGRFRVAKVHADADGAFRIRAKREVPHVLLAGAPANRLGLVLRADVVPGDDVEVRLERRRALRVRVLDEDGAAVGHAKAYPAIDDQLTTALYWELATVPAPLDGAFEVRVPPSTFRVVADAPGYSREASERFSPDSAPGELELRLRREDRLTGVVTAAGEPVAGAQVFLCDSIDEWVLLTDDFRLRYDLEMARASVFTDDDGRFELPAERTEQGALIAARADGYAIAELGPFPGDGRGLDGLRLELVRGGAIEGRLRFPDGRDPGGQLIAATAGAGRIAHVRTDADGAFRIEHLRPGPWLVEHRPVERDRSWGYTRRAEFDAIEWTCTVRDGATTRLELVALREASVRGVLTVDGAGADGWSAMLDARGGLVLRDADVASRAALLDADGAFELSDSPGARRLVLRSPPGAEGEVVTLLEELDLRTAELDWQAALTTGELEVRASDEAVLRLRLPLGARMVWTELRVDAGAARAFRVPAGEHGVQRRTSDGGWQTLDESVRVLAGGAASLEL